MGNVEEEEEIRSPTEALRLYFTEVKDLPQGPHYDVENVHMNAAEQATDFLQKAGLTDLTTIYARGLEITHAAFDESVRERHLTEKQANTVKSRVETLNRTLRKRQHNRRRRQDVRDVTWRMEETSSTGTRSRSATPDPLDDVAATGGEEFNSNEELQCDEGGDGGGGGHVAKTKVKLAGSESVHGRFLNKHDFGDVAHLGSKKVVLMGYHPLGEAAAAATTARGRNAADVPTVDVDAGAASMIETSRNILVNHLLTMDDDRTLVVVPKAKKDDDDEAPCGGGGEEEEELLSFEGLQQTNSAILDVLDRLAIGDDRASSLLRIGDVPECDYQHLRALLHVDVATLFDKHRVSIVRRKSTGKCKRGNVFGVKLTTLVMRDLEAADASTMVPQVYRVLLRRLRDHVREDGILRLAANKQRVDQLCAAIEANFYARRTEAVRAIDEASPHELSGALKRLLRELPEPIFTMELMDMFYKSHVVQDPVDKMRVLNLLVLLMPVEHRNTFHMLLEFFVDVVTNAPSNRMSRHNVAMIVAPSLFPPQLFVPKELNKLEENNVKRVNFEIHLAAVCCAIVELMLCAADGLFAVPPALYEQARRAKERALERKQRGPKKKKKKLQRSSTQYEPGATLSPRIKRDFVL